MAFAVVGVAVELPPAAVAASVAPLVLVSVCFTPFAVDAVASLDVLVAAAMMWDEPRYESELWLFFLSYHNNK